jgi:hypothetical protein
MKYCKKCNSYKPIEFFNKNKKTNDGLQSECKSCTRERDKKSYLTRGKDKYIQTQKNILDRNKQFIFRYKKLFGKCVDCGIKDYRVLQFDHISDKEYNISNMIHGRKSIFNIKKEIRKCEIRCANCHQIKTHHS